MPIFRMPIVRMPIVRMPIFRPPIYQCHFLLGISIFAKAAEKKTNSGVQHETLTEIFFHPNLNKLIYMSNIYKAIVRSK